MIGGLYWKKGTTQGAWASMITGTVMGLTGFIATHSGVLPESITGNVVFFFTIIASISAYVSVSLLTYKTPFNLEKMLHRGKYAIKEDDANVTLKELSRGLKAFGFTKEFTKSDKILYTGSIAWCLLWTVIFIFGTSYSLIFGISFDMWAKFWHIRLWVFFIVGVFLTIWLTYGGTKDVLYMFRHLKGYTRNNLDDGRVVNHHNLADEIKMRNNEDKTVINKASKSPIV
jgi:SSS family solute:Na+ symporter